MMKITEKGITEKLAGIPLPTWDASNGAHRCFPVLFLLGKDGDAPTFVLTRRSQLVPQPGDIAFPGGAIESSLDEPFAADILQGKISVYAYNAPAALRHSETMSLLTAAALREAHEEIGLPPANVAVMGILPAYDLRLFAKKIVPVVGKAKEAWQVQLSAEVEKLLEVPLTAFFAEKSYVCLRVSSALREEHFPALAIPRDGGGEDILWGATMFIITDFLQRCFNFHLPDWRNSRSVTRCLDAGYIRGGSVNGDVK